MSGSMLFIISLHYFSCCSSSQSDSSGVFITSKDYQDHVLTLATDCTTPKYKIIQYPTTLVFYTGIKKYKFQIKDIFGYRDCAQKDYRFYHGAEYEILNLEDIVIYRRYVPAGSDGNLIEFIYYFSRSIDSDIYILSRRHLRQVFSDKTFFLSVLKSTFPKDRQLTMIDPISKRFKLAIAYHESELK